MEKIESKGVSKIVQRLELHPVEVGDNKWIFESKPADGFIYSIKPKGNFVELLKYAMMEGR